MPTIVISENTVRDFTGTVETDIKEGSPTANDNANNIEVTNFAVGDRNNTLIRFPGLSNITGPVTVTSVTLSLYMGSASGDNTVDVHKVLRNWSETQATWNVYTTGNSWATAGATGTGDINGTASGSKTVLAAGVGAYVDITSTGGMAADVQDWINNGSNFGWLIKRQDYTAYNSTFNGFVDHENGGTTQCPKLSVTYSTSAGTFLAESEWQPLEPQTNPLVVSLW